MYYIIDNFLSDSHFKTISDYVLSSKYAFKDHTTYPGNITKDLFDYQFSKIITYLTEQETYRGVPKDELNKIMPFWNKLELILYFTTCDGYTLLKKKDETIKVDSVANRVLIFPSIWLHTGCAPTNVKARFIMNTIFEINPTEKKSWMN